MSLAPGTTIGCYRIVSPLGAGGMGEVYRARDARLDRDVALKVLPDAVAGDADRLARFEREAKALARIEHPNILTIHEFGHDAPPGGTGRATYFAVTELLTGETLSSRLARERLSWRRAVEIGAAVADGLAAAHGQGIVHRDLKPDNLFLTADGRVKILDFGLATSGLSPASAAETGVSPAGATADASDGAAETGVSPAGATAPGSVLGTVGYMSPEQVQGTEVDGRADLFALGCVLYEMVTGRRAFARPTPTETLAAILSAPVPEVTAAATDAPSDLARIVTRCVEKQPAARFQSAADLAFALRALLTAPADVRGRDTSRPHQVEQASIVVLPFENLSPDPDNAFFADGLTEEIIADLSKIRALRVISRTSAMVFKGAKKSAPAIARELNVRHVLEGSVRRAGNNLRITAQLIDATTDAHLWAEKYSGTLDNVFDLQEHLSRRIVAALKGALTPEEDRRLAARSAADPRAYEVWLRVRHAFHEMSRDGFERGMRLATQAMETIGESGLLHAAVAWFGYAMYDFGFAHDAETLARAERSAQRALELSPDLAQAHFVDALVRYKHGDFLGMTQGLRRSLDLEWSADAAGWLSLVLTASGRTDEGRRHGLEAVAADPLSWLTSLTVAMADLFDGRIDEAIARLTDSGRRLDPGGPLSTWWLAQAFAYAGREAEARDLFDQVVAMEASVFSDTARLFALALREDRAGVREWLDRAESMRAMALTDEIYPTVIAASLARAGDSDGALEWVGHAVSWGFTNDRFLAEHNRFLAPLRGDPRFEALMDRAREKQRAVAAVVA